MNSSYTVIITRKQAIKDGPYIGCCCRRLLSIPSVAVYCTYDDRLICITVILYGACTRLSPAALLMCAASNALGDRRRVTPTPHTLRVKPTGALNMLVSAGATCVVRGITAEGRALLGITGRHYCWAGCSQCDLCAARWAHGRWLTAMLSASYNARTLRFPPGVAGPRAQVAFVLLLLTTTTQPGAGSTLQGEWLL